MVQRWRAVLPQEIEQLPRGVDRVIWNHQPFKPRRMTNGCECLWDDRRCWEAVTFSQMLMGCRSRLGHGGWFVLDQSRQGSFSTPDDHGFSLHNSPLPHRHRLQPVGGYGHGATPAAACCC